MIHFVVENGHLVREDDIKLVFGPLEDVDEVRRILDEDLAAMAVEAGVFSSKSQARKNGFHGPAPHGLHRMGTKKRRFWVWNPHPTGKKVVCNVNFDRSSGWFANE